MNEPQTTLQELAVNQNQQYYQLQSPGQHFSQQPQHQHQQYMYQPQVFTQKTEHQPQPPHHPSSFPLPNLNTNHCNESINYKNNLRLSLLIEKDKIINKQNEELKKLKEEVKGLKEKLGINVEGQNIKCSFGPSGPRTVDPDVMNIALLANSKPEFLQTIKDRADPSEQSKILYDLIRQMSEGENEFPAPEGQTYGEEEDGSPDPKGQAYK